MVKGRKWIWLFVRRSLVKFFKFFSLFGRVLNWLLDKFNKVRWFRLYIFLGRVLRKFLLRLSFFKLWFVVLGMLLIFVFFKFSDFNVGRLNIIWGM